MIKFIKPKKYQRSIFFILTAILIVFMAGVIIGPLGVIKITSSLAVLIIIPFFVSFVANIFYQWYLKNRAKITKVKPFPKMDIYSYSNYCICINWNLVNLSYFT